MRKILTLTAALVALAACARDDGPAAVEALDPWCRPTPEGALTAACYVTLTASTDDRLLGASTPAAERAEVHTMSMDGGIMRMRRLDEGLVLKRNAATALAPSGEHLMLISPKAALVAGGTVGLTLAFEKAPAITVQAAVRQPMLGGAAH